MSVVVVVAYVAIVAFIVLALVRLAGMAFEMLGPSRRRWEERSGPDRRQRQTSVEIDRRCGPRRQDDIAAEFLLRLRSNPVGSVGEEREGQKA